MRRTCPPHRCWLGLSASHTVYSGPMKARLAILTALRAVSGIVDENAIKCVVVAVDD